MLSQTAKLAMTDPSPEFLFDDAVEAIQHSISEEFQKTLQDHADVTSVAEHLRIVCASNQKEYQRLQACARKVMVFSVAFAPYFEVNSLYGHVKPHWSGHFWGLVALVFQAGSNYVVFLERIADMFQSIAHVLPQYRGFQRSLTYHSNAQHKHQLTTLMSHTYADIIQFCLDLYRIFHREPQGARLRHRASLSSAVPPLWRPLDKRFALLHKRLVRHRRWVGEEERGPQDESAIARFRKDYFDFLNERTETSGDGSLESERMARRLRRVDKIKAWLENCCAYRDVFEHRNRQRHPNTCTWFLNTPQYCKWKSAPFEGRLANDEDELQTSWHERIVFVQAKIGFGKTFISGQVINDLTAVAHDLNTIGEPPTTAFFHFNAAHLYCTHPNDAFRALAVQLVHAHRHDRKTLDALALLMRKTAIQEKASSDDVLAVCSLLLRQHSTFVVIDGIDECSDPDLFLTLLPELCRKSDARVLLFSRPNIKIPLMYQKWASDAPHIISLEETQNAADIYCYVTENLNSMADQGFFGISMDRSLINKVTSRANGAFLWASLLLKYLQSPGFTPDERRAALEETCCLEGLEVLYHRILAVLDRQNEREKKVAVYAFRWLSLSIRRLCIPGSQVALAIIPGQPTTEDQYLSNFSESIPYLTGGLVEVTDCSVLFTHRSAKEYLQSPQCQDSVFSLFDESSVHAHLAARCISFLANDMAKRPLHRLQPYVRDSGPPITGSGTSVQTERSGDSGYKSMSSASSSVPENDGVAPNKGARGMPACFDDDIPFLRYASLFWPIHLTRALTLASLPESAPIPTSSRSAPWLPALSHFLTDRLAVTAWVEASWRYSLPPNISRLVPLLSELKSQLPPATAEGRELRWVIGGLRQLSDALVELKSEFATTLGENPSLIWQGNIRGWPVWDERRAAVRSGQ